MLVPFNTPDEVDTDVAIAGPVPLRTTTSDVVSAAPWEHVTAMARELHADGCATSGAGRSFGAAKGCCVMDGALAVASHAVKLDAMEADRVDGELYVRPAEESSTDAGVACQLGWRLLCARSRCLLQYEASNRSRISNLPWIARRGLPHW